MARLVTFGLGAGAADVLRLGLAAGAAVTLVAEVLRLTSTIVTTRGLSSPICISRALSSAIDLEET